MCKGKKEDKRKVEKQIQKKSSNGLIGGEKGVERYIWNRREGERQIGTERERKREREKERQRDKQRDK